MPRAPVKPAASIHVGAFFTPDMHARAKRLAHRLGRPFSTLLQDAMGRLLDEHEEQEAQRAAQKRAERAARAVRPPTEYQPNLGGAGGAGEPAASKAKSGRPVPHDYDHLIAYVAAARTPDERQARLERVVEIVTQTTASDEEARNVVEALDARARKLREKDPRLGELLEPWDDEE